MAEQAIAAGVGRPGQYRTVYSGMDVDSFLDPKPPRDEVRRALGLADDEVAFGTVARLFERKGHDDILAVAPRDPRREPEGPIRVHRRRHLARPPRKPTPRGWASATPSIFTGLVPPDRIPGLLGAMDAVVHPSLREGLARVLPQSLLVGRPVVSYDVDGAREVVLPETGILLSPRDLDGLAAAILRLAADPVLREAMGQEGRGGSRDQFRHETMTDQLRSLYLEVLAARRRRRASPARISVMYRASCSRASRCSRP